MSKFKTNYLSLKQELQELLSDERQALIYLHAFCVAKLTNTTVKDILQSINLPINLEKLVEILDLCNKKINDSIVFDMQILARTFELNLDQKQNGIFYTDELVVDYVNKNCVYSTILKKLSSHFKKNVSLVDTDIADIIKNNKSLKDYFLTYISTLKISQLKQSKNIINSLRFFDPTCGDGAFLINIFKELNTVIGIINNKLSIIEDSTTSVLENNIFGNDLSLVTIDFLKIRFFSIITELTGKHPENIKFNFFNSDFLEFDNIAEFDCIVGNPPYFESKTLNNKGYKTEKINNIYAPILERCSQFLAEDGVIGMIVPISLIATPRMLSLRELLKEEFNTVFISSFADRPASLFSRVHQKINIFIGLKNNLKEKNIYTSSYYYFNKEEYNQLFSNISYIENNWTEHIHKYGNITEKNISNSISNKNENIFNYIVPDSTHSIYLNMRVGFWIKCFVSNIDSNEYKKLSFKSAGDKHLFMAILNSNLFYLFWNLDSDGWHITLKNLERFKFDLSKLNSTDRNKLIYLSKQLEKDLEKNKERIDSKQATHEYKHKKSKIIIDKIDNLLKDIYDFDENTLKYIKFYNLKYRMSNDYNSYLEKISATV